MKPLRPGRTPRHVPRRRATRSRLCLAIVALAPLLASATPAQLSDIVNTKHNLSISGPGQIRAQSESRICIFCHTPHNASPLSPLWNKEMQPRVYSVYASPTLNAGPLPQPSGSTKLCLSCHDGTIALGAVLNPAGGISMAGSGFFAGGSLSEIGLDLAGHHPVSFSYRDALPNAALAPAAPADLLYGGLDEVHCTTCHDPHKDVHGKFLAKDNRFSALCVTCHQIEGWSGSAHATSTASVGGILPRPPKTWPTWTQLGEWGCEACHTPHFAPTAEQLLNFTALPPTPFSCTSAGCHSSAPASPHPTSFAVARTAGIAVPAAGMADIAQQTRKVSAHREPLDGTAFAARSADSLARTVSGGVACADCHDPHLAANWSAEAPYVSGKLRGASGVDRYGAPHDDATYEYEICFKCHADNTPDRSYVARVVDVTNTRRAFDPANASYHPVVSSGKNLNVPSIPSRFEPAMSASDMIYCTSCHADDEGGARGPHGSSFAPILRERYETADNTPESYESYALCYRCHERQSILADTSFQKRLRRTTPSGGGHSGHLRAVNAPCSACHDAHGVNAVGTDGFGGAGSGSHTHLINFDTTIVCGPRGCQDPQSLPVFRDSGTFAGSCTLVCHGVVHDDLSYP